MEKLVKIGGIALLVSTLIGCTVPGNYVTTSSLSKDTYINGIWRHPRIVQINADLLMADRQPQGIRNLPQDIPDPDGKNKGIPNPNIANSSQNLRDNPRYTVAPGRLFEQKQNDYRIGRYDVLAITVWDHPELSTPTMPLVTDATSNMTSGSSDISQNIQLNSATSGILVSAKGKIFFPYAGSFKVAGMTTDQIHLRIQQRLKRYIKNPQVSVRVAAYRSQLVNVIGEVQKPTMVSITDKPLTILGAITIAGGTNPNDSDTTHIYVIRGSITDPLIFILNAQSAETLLVADKFTLKSGDIIYVPATGGTNWNKVISKILPTIQTIWYTKTITS